MHRHNRVLVIAIYSHPEYYPPTLSALENLSPLYESIYLLHGITKGFDWKYPDNVTLVGSGESFEPDEVQAASVDTKVSWFTNFTRSFYSLVKKRKPDTILLYDVMPVLSYRLISPWIKKPKILWYHNHDVAEKKYIRRYSLGWFAWKSEKWIFPRLNIFSLPAIERKAAFPMNLFKGDFVFLPNFPSRFIYKNQELKNDQPGKTIRLLFQGSIGTGHGFEQIIPILKEPVSGHPLQLILKGFVSKEYAENLRGLAVSNGVEDRLIFIGPTGYAQVIENARSCDIGIGIHMKQDIMNSTLGTASNKIYEYAALGLPVLVYDNKHFRKTLGKYSWVIFTDASERSLKNCLQEIINNLPSLSKEAGRDFDQLSFENYFKEVITILN
jgi:glycosyltransferase involved in cell wall biosynthesis